MIKLNVKATELNTEIKASCLLLCQMNVFWKNAEGYNEQEL